jgi:5-methyltetrahydrofolate--homocysteine methyltransferase
MKDALISAFVDIREQEALDLAHRMLEDGESPLEVLEACRAAMTEIGRRFEAGEAFVPELVMAGEMMKTISAKAKSRLATDAPLEKRGKVIMGTVVGDIHDIGKEIVVFMLDVNGFEVVDLGVDVEPEVFVEAIRDSGATVVGMSGLLTLAFQSMKETVDAISEAGLRDAIKIMIGGAPVDEHVQSYSGADAWGKDAMTAVSLADQWIGG